MTASINRPKVAIVDFGLGNLFSVKLACETAGLDHEITNDRRVIERSDAMILPGVGAFGEAMATLESHGLVTCIMDFIASGRAFLGICLGMQLLMSESEEFGRHKGIGFIDGRVVRFNNLNGEELVKVPQIGWNRIFSEGQRWEETHLNGIPDGAYMYFVHSYYAIPSDPRNVLSVTDYGGRRYCSGVSKDNVTAFQFHPEKSGVQGIKIYTNWALNIKRQMEAI
ncbi:MAG TPA: imidazole glycerol phosphate synthase subunit HisH [Deltaproteobacteria bacterium]|nr:MAG: imidazole glycerol phosphate synthase, glutamine amidotransferase subunit [Deltaproteobacteria bacterium GWA2_55_82]OGQ63572.1 MAG: imidazole glycerol phosphate synthase, glutamine amidotransferase subunit [Deltaproteobacteria bacterium RIFCSPLOWO2_02_FULL_55_12]OIJ75169.1 MAG: imidazole glycerol phosphate synthase, glutamine amidotransferase subunit [Deltaproteobacteria bacterium GWC2_55_46]HBG47509.1 imidazole glycerol phosphate synthase subunit HisH [Deltaproteobacteria bacterium]HCY